MPVGALRAEVVVKQPVNPVCPEENRKKGYAKLAFRVPAGRGIQTLALQIRLDDSRPAPVHAPIQRLESWGLDECE